MKIYRITLTNEHEGIVWRDITFRESVYEDHKGCTTTWDLEGRNKLTLEVAEIPDDAWTIEEAAVDYPKPEDRWLDQDAFHSAADAA